MIDDTLEVAEIVILVSKLLLDLATADVLATLNIITQDVSSFIILSHASVFYPSRPTESNYSLQTDLSLLMRAYARLSGRSMCGDTRHVFQRTARALYSLADEQDR